MPEYSIPIIISSDPELGAENLSSIGSSFCLTLSRPLIIPTKAISVYITATKSTVWWTVPNILTGNNDVFNISHFDGVSTTVYNLIIPQGLYALNSLDSEINRQLVNQGAPTNLITITGNSSTSHSIIRINVPAPETISIDFTVPNNIRGILGFNSQVIPAQSGVVSITSNNIANFNVIDYFLINTSLISNGLRTNDKFLGTIAQININVPAGSEIINEPFNPPKIPANELIGSRISNITFTLTDQLGNLVDTNGEFWTCRFVISYVIRDEHKVLVNRYNN
jgi:hypothetical protein